MPVISYTPQPACLITLLGQSCCFMHLIATCDVCPRAQSSNRGFNGDSLGICSFYASLQSGNEKKFQMMMLNV